MVAQSLNRADCPVLKLKQARQIQIDAVAFKAAEESGCRRRLAPVEVYDNFAERFAFFDETDFLPLAQFDFFGLRRFVLNWRRRDCNFFAPRLFALSVNFGLRGFGRRRCNVADFNAEIVAQRGKSAAETCARRIELPRAAIAINFAEDNRRFDAEIFKRERRNFPASTENPKPCAANHAEILFALIGFVNGCGQRNSFDVARNFFQVNVNRIVVVMRDGSGIVSGVAVKNKVLVARNFAVRLRQKCRRVNFKRTRRTFKLNRQKVVVERNFLPLAKLHHLTVTENL